MGANSALIFGIIINVAILLVFFRFLMQLAAGLDENKNLTEAAQQRGLACNKYAP